MKKVFISLLALMTIVSLQASNFFVTPDGSGDRDGSSWENALSATDVFVTEGTTIYGSEAVYPDHSNFYFATGTYYPTNTAGGDLHIKKLYNIYGGYENRRGQDITAPDYVSQKAATIFSGDLNGNNIADPEDARCVLHYKIGSEVDDSLVIVKGLTIMYGYGSEADGYNGAFFIQQTRLDAQYCRMLNNGATNNGGAGMMVHGGRAHIMDCEFAHNWAGQYGAAVRTSNNKGHMCTAVFDRCCFHDNTLSTSYGGAILQSGGTIYLLNCSFVGNQAINHGGAISLKGINDSNPNNISYIVSCTFAGNECSAFEEQVEVIGSQIRLESNVKTYFCNNIVVGKFDYGDTSNPALCMKGVVNKFSDHIENGSFNTLGTWIVAGSGDGFVNDMADVMTTRDSWGMGEDDLPINTYEKLYNKNVLQDNGGFLQSLMPEKDIKRGASTKILGADGSVLTAIACPFTVDLTVDMLGNPRATATTCGAVQWKEASALNTIHANYNVKKYINEKGQFIIQANDSRYSVLGVLY